MDFQYIIFSDGACSGNPGPGGWGTLLIKDEKSVKELAGRDGSTTNNRMELQAAIEGLKLVPEGGQVNIYTDSTYVIRGITQWVYGWRRNQWKTAQGEPVANQDLWEILSRYQATRKIKWSYVRGHSGFAGNERVDNLAVSLSQNTYPSLYDGPLANYPYNIFPLPPEVKLPEMTSGSKNKEKAFSYLSLVNGKLTKHSDWPSCQARVKGVSGARFKKAMSASEELEIITAWGLDPAKLKE